MACFSHNNLKYDLQRRQVERKRSFRQPPDSYAVGRRSFLQIVRGRNGIDHELQTRAAPIGTE